MDTPDINPWFALAAETIQFTSQNLFLTGKAGTGKTTFLRHIKQHTHKNAVVVAPTGVAAINAGGVTMHSFFQLPFVPYLAERPLLGEGGYAGGNWVDRYSLLKGLRMNREKEDLINELDLLIIDEVSMMRADTLDAINDILCHVRQNNKPFGGLQVLFIGDLFQLPPVVQDHEWQIIQEYYKSPFFFSARVLQDNIPLFIELKKVYRQSEEQLINLLNNIRHNTLTEEDYKLLTERYMVAGNAQHAGTITLTTHNRMADEINRRELQRLPGSPITFKGEIKGSFSEKALPADMELHLKPGAQVMFTKNDSTGGAKYYNGKIATVKTVTNEEIIVRFNENEPEFKVGKEVWRTVEYALNKESNSIHESETGSFTQYPLRLAWAVTIHKSQGLSFDKVLINAGQSFASGQVYVALSRCRKLDGIYLLSPIHPGAIINDERIVEFASKETPIDELRRLIDVDKIKFAAQTLVQIFDWHKVVRELEHLDALTQSKGLAAYNVVKNITPALYNLAKEQQVVADKFIVELNKKFNEEPVDIAWLKTKVPAAKTYFLNRLQTEIINPVNNIFGQLKGEKQVRKYLKVLNETNAVIMRKAREIHKAAYMDMAFEANMPEPVAPAPIVVPASAGKVEKGLTKRITLDLYKKGMTVAQIAEHRNMAASTIEGHLAESLDTGEINISDFVAEPLLSQVKELMQKLGVTTFSPLKAELDPEVTYGQLKMAVAYWKMKGEVAARAGSVSLDSGA